MSKTNPSGYGLALEIGYAKALNKMVILVDDRSANDKSFNRYFEICHQTADLVFSSLEESLKFLHTFQI